MFSFSWTGLKQYNASLEMCIVSGYTDLIAIMPFWHTPRYCLFLTPDHANKMCMSVLDNKCLSILEYYFAIEVL